MKKLILIIVILSTTVNYSQSKKNNKKLIQSKQVSKFEMGLSTGFDFQKGVNNLSRSFALTNLYAGYYINPKTEIGLKISKSFIKEADNFGFGIFGRRYFNNFYGGLVYNRTNYTFQNTNILGNQFKTYQNINSFAIEAGYRFKISNNFKLETTLNTEFFLNKQLLIASTAYGIRLGVAYGF